MAKEIIAAVFVVGVVLGLAVGSGALVAWAFTAIWPQLPFWPVAILATIILGALSNNRR
jgi:hypothetical protein